MQTEEIEQTTNGQSIRLKQKQRLGLRVHTVNNTQFEEGKPVNLQNIKYFLRTSVQSATSRKTPRSDASNAVCVP